MKKMFISLLLAFALLLTAGLALAEDFPALANFQAMTLDGKVFTQDDLAKADVTVLNIWSVTCPPCIAEMPDLAAFAKTLPDNVQVLTVCLDAGLVSNNEVQKFLTERAGFEGQTLIGGDGDFQTVMSQVLYTPTTLFVDAQGRSVGSTVIGGQQDLAAAYTASINEVLEASGKPLLNVATASDM